MKSKDQNWPGGNDGRGNRYARQGGADLLIDHGIGTGKSSQYGYK